MTSPSVAQICHSASFGSLSTTSIDYTSPHTPSLPSNSQSPHVSVTSHADHDRAHAKDSHYDSPLIRMPSGIVSARVGLGSPKIDFGREWVGGNRRKGSDEPIEEVVHVEPTELARRDPRGLVDNVSGLPSPPKTESDIALPNVYKEPSLMTESPPASLSPSPKIHLQTLRRTSSVRSRPILPRTPSMVSSASGSGNPPSESSRVKVLRSNRGSGMSRSNSSSSSLAVTHLRPKATPSPGNGSAQSLHPIDTREANVGDSASSKASLPRSASHLRDSPSSSSPSKTSSRHHHSPSAPLPNPPSAFKRRGNASQLGSSVEDAGSRPGHSRRASSGTDLDTRILEAEEKIRYSGNRRSRTSEIYPPTPPPRKGLRRYDSYSRGSISAIANQAPIEGDTLRRSSTLSEADNAANAKTPGIKADRARSNEQERSGGSAGSRPRKPLPTEFRNGGEGGLFTPSPKPSVQGYRPSRQIDLQSPTGTLSKFNTTSRLAREQNTVPSPSSPKAYSRTRIEGLDRTSSVSSRLDRRQWSESAASPSRRNQELDLRDHPSPRRDPGAQRAESVMDSSSSNRRYLRDRDLAPRPSKLNLAPGDSISAVGTRSERLTPSSNKDPLEVLKRIEAQREEHNRSWERSASVLGDNSPARQGSGSNVYASPQRVRPATSMSSLKERYDAPRTAPVDRAFHRPYDDSPLLNRTSSRLSRIHPSSEPRQMRSSTSLGGRSSQGLDIVSASSDHGRLLYEAYRALELKLPQEALTALPDISRTFGSAARSAETSNAVLREALQLLNQIGVDAELDADPGRIFGQLQNLMISLREATRSSDQNVRDLTRVMLDVPKLLREGSRLSHPGPNTVGGPVRGDRASEVGRRWHVSGSGDAYESPVRRSEEMLRPTTSMGALYDTDRRRNRDSLPASFGMPDRDRERGLLSKMRNLAPSRQRANYQNLEHNPNLGTIEDSPPTAQPHVVPTPQPYPLSPMRRVLKKKASSTSTHTVRAGNNNFLPTTAKAPTTALSTVTAGNIASSPRSETFGGIEGGIAVSYRSKKSSSDWDDMGPSSPMSRFSYHTAEEPSGSRAGSGGPVGEDDVLEVLVAAQKRREASVSEAGGTDEGVNVQPEAEVSKSVIGKGEEGPKIERKWSVSDRFRATLRRGGRGVE